MRLPFAFLGSTGAPPSVPVVVSITPNLVDVSGGTARKVVEVDNSTGCTGITAGGVAFTSFAIDDITHVSGIPGAHAAGSVDVVVTNGGGPSTTGTGLLEYWDISDQSPSSYWKRPDYSEAAGVGTFTATDGVNLTVGALAPTEDGDAPKFEAGVAALASGESFGTWIPVTEKHVLLVFDLDAVSSTAGLYMGRAILADAAGWFAVCVYSPDAGATNYVELYDGAGGGSYARVDMGASSGRFIVQARQDASGDLWIRVNAGAWTAGSTSVGTTPGSTPIMGSNYSGDLFEGTVIAAATFGYKGDSFANKAYKWGQGFA